jgi:O-antigen ligase
LHLVPLPPALWMALPGRSVIVELQNAAGIAAPWRPLTIAPAEAWNAAFSLLVPVTALVLGSQLSRDQLARLLPVLLFLGALTAMVGLLQLLAGGRGALYLYTHTNPGSPVGLFANANHQAVYLAMLLPMLAIWGGSSTGRRQAPSFRPWLALLAGAFIIPLVIVVGSRAGIIAMAIALAATPMLLRHKLDQQAKAQARRRWQIAGIVSIIGALSALALLFSGSTALQAFAATNAGEDRTAFWPTIASAAMDHFPLGSGAGSFVEMYKVYEPTSMLRPTYLNHAHNDWLEIFATLGLPGIALLAVALWWVARRSLRAVTAAEPSSRVQRARLGSVMIAIFALASIVDYPLRTPALMAVLVIAALWLAAGTRRDDRVGAASEQGGNGPR